MSTNEFCSVQYCKNYGCGSFDRENNLCNRANPPAKPSTLRRGIDCDVQTPRWSVKDCRNRKCPDLKNTTEYGDAQERCHALSMEDDDHSLMPGTLTHCIKDLDHMPPEEWLKHVLIILQTESERGNYNRKTPGVKNCPPTCPMKISTPGEKWVNNQKKAATIWRCAFVGDVLGMGMGRSCPCHVLDNPDQEAQIAALIEAIELHRVGTRCAGICPDGIKRAGTMTKDGCPVCKVPIKDIAVCPLWRIPAKLLPAQVAQISEKNCDKITTKSQSDEPAQKEKTSSRKLSQKEKPAAAASANGAPSQCPPASAQKTKPSPQGKHESPPGTGTDCSGQESKRKRKEKTDPVCEACRERNHGHVAEHVCAWCEEEQEKFGRRAWTTLLQLGVVHLGDMQELGEQVPEETTDLICTDPPYIDELWENAYGRLGELAARVLKPYGFLITYAPQAHLDEIIEILSRSGDPKQGRLQYFWIISSINAGATCKAHKWNALCLHKPILVYQKLPKGEEKIRGVRRCFADVVRGLKQKKFHPWQQSVHDVLGIISRFMDRGEILLDPYAGTGTTLIAGQLLGMEVIGFEIEEKTHAIAVREMQQKPIGLFTFGGDEPEFPPAREVPEEKDPTHQGTFKEIADPAKEARPIELKAACLRCKVRDGCTTHDPYTNCRKIEAGKIAAAAKETGPRKEACIDCDSRKKCPSHDPRAGCERELREGKRKVEEKKDVPNLCENCSHLHCEIFDSTSPDCQFLHPLQKSGGPTPGTCGTCGHHKGKKTFHESCPRLLELLFKGGTKSAKVLMEETQRDRCESWIVKSIKTEGKPERGSPEWLAALTESKRKNNPQWLQEVWKIDPAKGGWLYEGAATESEIKLIMERLEETRPEGTKIRFEVRQRPAPNYSTRSMEGPCKTCGIECIDDNNGCEEFDQHCRKLDGEPPEEYATWPVCIISCGKAKIWDIAGKKKVPKKVYAQDAYTGPIFMAARKYAETQHRGPWFILSDKYGLILPGEEIENYDVAPEDIKDDSDFFDQVQQKARADPDLSRTKKVILIAGKIHQEIIERVFPGIEIINPVQGLPQGKRLKALKALTSEEKSASKKSKKESETP